MTPDELDKLLTICRKHDVTIFTDGKIRIAFGPRGEMLPLPKHDGMVPVPQQGQRKMTDYERFLFAATEGYPDDDEAFVPVPADTKQ